MGRNPATNIIEYITFSTTGNATDFGDTTFVDYSRSGFSSPTRGVFGGGYNNRNVIDYVTIASTGNATDFGDLTVGRYDMAGYANSTRGFFIAGDTGIRQNICDYITIATTGNATDFGDYPLNQSQLAGCCSGTRGVQAGGNSKYLTIYYQELSTLGSFATFGDLLEEGCRSLAGSTSSAHGGLS
jgi:hypothetical protein